MTRSESREQALKLIFQKTFSPEMTLNEIAVLNLSEEDTVSDTFAISLAGKTVDNVEMLDGIISSKLVKWTISRLPRITLCILRMSVAEIVLSDDTPVAVVANEAVELMKKYVGEKEAGFVNGVLGAVIRDKSGDVQPEENESAANAEAGPADNAE